MKTKTLDERCTGAAAEIAVSDRPKPVTMLLATLRQIAFWYERWRQRQDLAELDDHILRDIGISPREVERECAKPCWRR